MNEDNKKLLDIELAAGETITEETVEELSNGKGDNQNE
jgi:hypothetical protein